jgi:hypothetical protein
MPALSELRDTIERETPAWLAESDLASVSREKIRDWLDGKKDRFNASVPSWYEQIYMEEIRRYCLSRLLSDDRHMPLASLVRTGYSSFLYKAGIKTASPAQGLPFDFQHFAFYQALVISVGWRAETELMARVAFKMMQPLFDGGHVVWSLPWFMLDLTRDWLGADVNLRDQDRKDDILVGWRPLLDKWRVPDPAEFDVVLKAAADYHLEQSHVHIEVGHDEDRNYRSAHFEIEPSEYWLFPVELFAVLRLREWEGLANPELTHPLFNKTQLGRMPSIQEPTSDPVMDAVDAKFRSLYPGTPSIADLPSLRAEQSTS